MSMFCGVCRFPIRFQLQMKRAFAKVVQTTNQSVLSCFPRNTILTDMFTRQIPQNLKWAAVEITRRICLIFYSNIPTGDLARKSLLNLAKLPIPISEEYEVGNGKNCLDPKNLFSRSEACCRTVRKQRTTTKLRNRPENNFPRVIPCNRLRQFRAIPRKTILSRAMFSEWRVLSCFSRNTPLISGQNQGHD